MAAWKLLFQGFRVWWAVLGQDLCLSPLLTALCVPIPLLPAATLVREGSLQVRGPPSTAAHGWKARVRIVGLWTRTLDASQWHIWGVFFDIWLFPSAAPNTLRHFLWMNDTSLLSDTLGHSFMCQIFFFLSIVVFLNICETLSICNMTKGHI